MIDLHVFVHSLFEKRERKKNQRTTILMCWCQSNIHPRNEEQEECKKRKNEERKERSLFFSERK
jgi:hypothetical protein